MKVYVRKLLDHDITHEISITTNIVKEFFDSQLSFNMFGKKTNEEGIVTINSATDPRLGGDFKKLLRDEGDVDAGDIILIYKYQNHYAVDIINKQDVKYDSIMEITKEDIRHSILYTEEILPENYMSEDRKNRFRTWLTNKNEYSDNTINNYVRYITYIKNRNLIDYDLYSVNDITKIDELLQKFNSDEKFIEYDNQNNRNPYYALIQYKNFLLSELEYNSNKSPLDQFIEYFNKNIENVKSTLEITPESLKREFLEEYPISRFKTMNLDEYSMGLNDASTFCRQVEGGKYKNYGARCTGDPGGASHWGIFFRDEKKVFQDSSYNDLSEPNEYWNEFRKELYEYLLNLSNENPIFSDSYPMLKNMSMTLPKLCYMYYPEKFVNINAKTKLQELYDIFELEYDYSTPADKLSYDLNKYIRNNVPNAENEHTEYITNILWNFREEKLKDTSLEEIDLNKIEINNDSRVTDGYNVIYYGIPGCGKSWIADDKAKELTNKNEDFIIRTTFYPDYNNSDFIGQIIPKIDENDQNNVLYDIQSGPFTNALVKAIDNPSSYVCLIIEEINRGNAAAIFGDLFQLLDRNEKGESVYSIENYTIAKYLEKNCKNSAYDFSEIRIPSNLVLIGTMNTSDQNVFTLDTAFKRRWNMKYITNDVDNSKFAKEIVPMINIEWKEFVRGINNAITHNGNDLGINGEDKQIGAYFISDQEWKKINTSSEKKAARIFAEKVLSYIWEDVAKLDKKTLFNGDYNRFEDVLKDFLENKDVLDVDFGGN